MYFANFQFFSFEILGFEITVAFMVARRCWFFTMFLMWLGGQLRWEATFKEPIEKNEMIIAKVTRFAAVMYFFIFFARVSIVKGIISKSR